jgi:hypothetical protein
MPVKKAKGKKKVHRNSDEDDNTITTVDIHYNPDIVDGMLQDIESQTEAKCAQIKKDIDFMVTSMQQRFHLELIKLPNQVKQMKLSKFREEYGENIENVSRGIVNQNNPNIQSAVKSTKTDSMVFQTPSTRSMVAHTPRHPREGEVILSKNGSPLGEFSTAVKPAKQTSVVPPTPGIFVPLSTGGVVDIDSISTLPDDMKQDALEKMQIMMNNMQNMMMKIKKTEK